MRGLGNEAWALKGGGGLAVLKGNLEIVISAPRTSDRQLEALARIAIRTLPRRYRDTPCSFPHRRRRARAPVSAGARSVKVGVGQSVASAAPLLSGRPADLRIRPASQRKIHRSRWYWTSSSVDLPSGSGSGDQGTHPRGGSSGRRQARRSSRGARPRLGFLTGRADGRRLVASRAAASGVQRSPTGVPGPPCCVDGGAFR